MKIKGAIDKLSEKTLTIDKNATTDARGEQTTSHSVTLIITTYNRPDALRAVLLSVESQSIVPSSVIIADDGSDSTTLSILSEFRRNLPLIYVWQYDQQFRAARIRNLALLRSASEFIIFIDGDCILPPEFIRSHLKLLKTGVVVAGSRFLLSNETTSKICDGSNLALIQKSFRSIKFLRLKLDFLRDLGSRNWRQVRTCNMSLALKDALKICGFNEYYVGWGREDSDFVVRLLHAGIRIRSGRFAACVAHLSHPESERSHLKSNIERFDNLVCHPLRRQKIKSVLDQI